MQWKLLAGMTLSPPCYYIPSADVVAFKTSVCLLDYHAACSEGEKSPRAQLGLSIVPGTCLQKGWLAGTEDTAGWGRHWGQAGQQLQGAGMAAWQCSWPHQHPRPCPVLGQKSPGSGLLEGGDGVLCMGADKLFLLEFTREESFATHLGILRGNTVSSDENSGWSWQKQREDVLWETPHSSYCVSGTLAKVLSGRSRPHSLSWWRQERIMALSHVVCSPCWDHVHSPAGLMLVSVTPLIEFPPAPPLAMSHSSKSTLLLKKKPKTVGENKKSSQLQRNI